MRDFSRKGLIVLIASAFMTMTGYAAGAGNGHEKQMTRGGNHQDPMIQRMDRNNDGKISEKEFNKVMDKRFEALDSNNDGYVEDNELQAARTKARKRMKQYRKKLQQRQNQQRSAQ